MYYDALVDKLVNLIQSNGSKKEINTLTTQWVREIIDGGYNENYVYITLNEIFFQTKVANTDKITDFFNRFDFEYKKFDVYIGFQSDILSIKNLLSKIKLHGCKITALKP